MAATAPASAPTDHGNAQVMTALLAATDAVRDLDSYGCSVLAIDIRHGQPRLTIDPPPARLLDYGSYLFGALLRTETCAGRPSRRLWVLRKRWCVIEWHARWPEVSRG